MGGVNHTWKCTQCFKGSRASSGTVCATKKSITKLLGSIKPISSRSRAGHCGSGNICNLCRTPVIDTADRASLVSSSGRKLSGKTSVTQNPAGIFSYFIGPPWRGCKRFSLWLLKTGKRQSSSQSKWPILCSILNTAPTYQHYPF